MFAVIRTGGKQYRVTPDAVLKVEKLDAEPGASVTFSDVLLVGSERGLAVGVPFVPGASVSATVIAQDRLKKVIVFKKRRRQNSRRTHGHRQHVTVLRIGAIVAEGVAWDPGHRDANRVDPRRSSDVGDNSSHFGIPLPDEDAKDVDPHELQGLLDSLRNADEKLRARALNKLATFVVGDNYKGQRQEAAVQNGLRSIPNRLLEALIRDCDSELAGKAAAVALACFLDPELCRDINPDEVPEAKCAATLRQAFLHRGLTYFSTVKLTDQGPDGANVHVALRNSFGFKLGGEMLVLEPPGWLDEHAGVDVTVQGMGIRKVEPISAENLPPGTLAACRARIAPEADGPRRVSIYLRNGETVFDRFRYDRAELFPAAVVKVRNASSSSMKSPGGPSSLSDT